MDNTTLDFALMAGEAYFYKRDDVNKIPVPQGATLLPLGLEGRQLSSGFEARAYDYNGKIVISFAGTYFPDRFLNGLAEGSVSAVDLAGLKDWVANIQLGVGGLDGQLRDAARYYQEIKAANPGREFVFTGHSLGGGLAAVMGVLFNQEAITFDPAPFRAAATEANAAKLKTYLAGLSPAYDDAQLNAFSATQGPLFVVFPEVLAGLLSAVAAGGPITLALAAVIAAYPMPLTIRGEEKIRAIAVAGEFLTGDNFGDFRNRLRILGVGVELVDQGSIGKIAGGDAHSISLLYLLGKSASFQQLTKDMPGLLPLFFDKTIYGYSVDTSSRNFIESLLRQELGVSGIQQTRGSTGFLDKFVADARKLVQTDGMTGQASIQRALTIAAMDYYYVKEATNATQLFTTDGNAVHFDYRDIGAANPSSHSPLVAAVGAFVDANERRVLGMASDTVQFAKQGTGYLMQQDVWHIQSGTSGLNWTASGNANDAVIGGAQIDIIDAGDGNDILMGGANRDFLTGGAGNDRLLGGQDVDTYVFASQWGKDIISDNDGQGVVQITGQSISATKGAGRDLWSADLGAGVYAGLAVYTDASSSTGKSLVITKGGDTSNTITIKNFDLVKAKTSEGYLGIKLSTTVEVALVAQGTPNQGGTGISTGVGKGFWSQAGSTLESLAGKTSSFFEGAGKSFIINLNQGAKAGETVTLNVAGATSGLKAVRGADTVDASGAVFTLREGQTQVSFALVSNSPIDADQSGAVSVSYQGTGDNAQSATSNS